MEEAEEAGETQLHTRNRHIKKRSLKNKALSVSFDEKDLSLKTRPIGNEDYNIRDYVTGFHKRKKKRRKEAEVQLQEVHRRKRIEARKKRKVERELVYGGGAGPDEAGEDAEQDEESVPVPSILVEGTASYENGDVRVIVTTSEISREEELPIERPPAAFLASTGGDAKNQHRVPVNKKKPLKRVAKNRPRKKQQKKRDIRKGKTINNKLR